MRAAGLAFLPLLLASALRAGEPQPLPEMFQGQRPAKTEWEAPAARDPFRREYVTVRARAWLTSGSVNTRISEQVGVDLAVFTGETEQRGASGFMPVYSAEVAPVRWVSAEFEYGEDRPKGSYEDHFWLHSPEGSLQFSNGTVWNNPDHQDDLVFGGDAKSHRDWTAANVYARVLDIRDHRSEEEVWHETLDVAAGLERFRQDSSLSNLSVTQNQRLYYSPGLALGPVTGFASSYSASWTGPHFGFRDEVSVPYGFSFEGLFLWSPFMSYRGEGFDNLGTYWVPVRDASPNFEDRARGTAVHFRLGARWDWSFLRLEAGYQRLYLYSRSGTRSFFGADGSVTTLQLDYATTEIAGAYAGVALRY